MRLGGGGLGMRLGGGGLGMRLGGGGLGMRLGGSLRTSLCLPSVCSLKLRNALAASCRLEKEVGRSRWPKYSVFRTYIPTPEHRRDSCITLHNTA